jgi:uncharacterized membrane protein
MDVSDIPLATTWAVAGWVLAMVVLSAAALRAPWRSFLTGEVSHVVPAGILALSLLWSLRASIGAGYAFHLLGTAAFALTVGAPLALLGGAAVVGIVGYARGAPLMNAGLVWLASVAVPVAVATGVLAVAERRLPANFFVYVFAVCFFGAGVAFGAGGLASALVAVVAGGRPADVVFGEYVPYLLYLGFGEATLSGMWMTLAVVYRPRWVATFDDARYLRGQ